jgi:hypothetical protein
MSWAEIVHGETFHGRKGAVKNAFRYTVDYLLTEPEAVKGPALMARNRAGLMALHDADYGGAPGQGRGAAWVREVLAARGMAPPARILLLGQPRVLGHVFNPVSFWLCLDPAGDLVVALAEVTNTYGDRHSYLVARPDLGPITREDTIEAEKIFHVSPFQPVQGTYRFRLDLREDRVGVWIDYTAPDGGGLYTNLIGPRRPLTNRAILGAALRRPFGSRRVLALIHWQALKLMAKGVRFASRTPPPAEEVSR